MKSPETDTTYMQKALALAREGLGRVWPNPSVGCLIVQSGNIVGSARTADGGRPHAETLALAKAGKNAKGATAYVTLEPCNSTGQTGPCVDALIKAGISRVVIACRDPFQENFAGLEKLKQTGIEVIVGLCEAEAQVLNEGFFLTVANNRPMITAKLATSLDARIATSSGESKWITGELARQKGHELRASHDAILAGIGTVLADDPLLTVRLPDYKGPQPVRIVIDPNGKLPPNSRLEQTAKASPLWVIGDNGSDYTENVISLAADTKGVIHPKDILSALAARGITRLLIEGGGRTISHFLKAGLVDRLAWFRAPIIIGSEGTTAIGDLETKELALAPSFELEVRTALGDDILEIWRTRR